MPTFQRTEYGFANCGFRKFTVCPRKVPSPAEEPGGALNPLGNGLHAFEPRARIEIRALFAAVQIESATRALAFRVETLLQDGAAIGTSRARDGANHTRRARPDLILPWMAFGRAFLFLLGLVGTHVAPLLILPLQ